MKKEILLYRPFYSETAIAFLEQLELHKNSDIKVRMNTPGGDVYHVYGAIAKFMEHAKEKMISVDGMAASGGAFMCCTADTVECLNVTRFMFHRAATYWEAYPAIFTDEMRAELKTINADLRAIMEGKFTAEKWEKVTGVSLDRLFSMDERVDVYLTAKQAKSLGIVSKINPITAEKKAEMVAQAMDMTASYLAEHEIEEPPAIATKIIQKTKIMTLAEFKAEHPAVYAEAVTIGQIEERDRVGSFLAFVDLDVEAVTKGIKDGAVLTATQMAEFSRKAMNVKSLGDIQADSTKPLTTAEQPVAGALTAEQKEAAAFEAEVRANLGLK